MDLSHLSLDELKNNISFNKSSLGAPGADNSFIEKIIGGLTREYSRRLQLSLDGYSRILRPELFEVFDRLSQIMRRSDTSTSFLVRRAFFCAHYGMVMSGIFDPLMSDLAKDFDRLKLPLLPNPHIQLNSIYHGGLPLGSLLSKYVEKFKDIRKCRQEDHLRVGIWAPLLTDLINCVCERNGINNCYVVNEASNKLITDFPWDRYVDLAAIIEDGLPLLLVELAKEEVRPGMVHKDLKKMAIMMTFVLMDLLSRADVHCPGFDASVFRVYGILVAGRTFELCVGTVMVEDGKINFIFHNNDVHWKFALFGTELVPSDFHADEASEFVTAGPFSTLSRPEVSRSRTMVVDIRNLLNAESIAQILESDIGEEEEDEFARTIETEDVTLFQETGTNLSERSALVLFQFLNDATSYYNNLHPCLKECYTVNTANISESIYKFPPMGQLPALFKSKSTHGAHSRQTFSPAMTTRRVEDLSDSQVEFFGSILSKHSTLPDVVFLDSGRREAWVRDYSYDMRDLTQELSDFAKCRLDPTAVFDSIEVKRFKSARKLAEYSKFIIDMLLAAHLIHLKGFVCGAFERDFICFDGLFWRISMVPELCKVKEAPLRTIKCKFDSNDWRVVHLSSTPSQRDDLFSIGRTVLTQYLFLLDYADSSPLLQRFLTNSLGKMTNNETYPDITAEEIIIECAPIYIEILNLIGTNLGDFPHLVCTKQEAESFVSERSLENSQPSIVVEPISAVTESK